MNLDLGDLHLDFRKSELMFFYSRQSHQFDGTTDHMRLMADLTDLLIYAGKLSDKV